MTSIIKVDEIQNKAGTTTLDAGKLPTAYSGSAKLWARFDMSSASIDDSLNLGSLTDNGTGDFTFNFTNNMASANYAHVGTASYIASTTAGGLFATLKDGSSSYSAAASFRGETYYVTASNNRTNYDWDYVTSTIHGDLA